MHSGIFKAALLGPANMGLYGHHGAQLLFIIIWIRCISHIVPRYKKMDHGQKRHSHHRAENPSIKLYKAMLEDLLWNEFCNNESM